MALVARTTAALEAVAAEIAAAGGEAHVVPGDVGEKAAIHRIARQAMAALGGVDVLVHGASTLGHVPLRTLADTECEALERALAVNVLGPFRLTRALLGPMRLGGDALVIMVSSDAAVEAYPTWGAYGVSKAALEHLARIWSAEMEEHGVRVLVVDPGEMETAMHADAEVPVRATGTMTPRQPPNGRFLTKNPNRHAARLRGRRAPVDEHP